jgi:hypothetical protein
LLRHRNGDAKGQDGGHRANDRSQVRHLSCRLPAGPPRPMPVWLNGLRGNQRPTELPHSATPHPVRVVAGSLETIM